jgi:hypothetical protein
MSGAIPLLPLYAFMAWTGKTLPVPFSYVGGYQHFRRNCYDQDRKMEAVDFSETLVKTYRTTLCPNAEDHVVIAHKYEYLRSH